MTIHVTSAGCTIQTATEMREGPAIEYRVIDSLAAGTSVLPVGRNATGEWLRVQANREGWMDATAVKCTVPMLQFATISPAEIPPKPTSTPTLTPQPTDTPVPTSTPTPPATPHIVVTFKPFPIATLIFKPPVAINPGLIFVATAGSGIDDYVGHWVPDDVNWNGVVVIDIVKKNATQLGVHAYGKCSPTNCDWSEVIVTFTAEPVVVNFSNGGSLTISMNSYTSLRAVESGNQIDYHKP